jgi:hypothetical protein
MAFTTAQRGLLLFGLDHHRYSMIGTGKAMIFDTADSAIPYLKPDNLSGPAGSFSSSFY